MTRKPSLLIQHDEHAEIGGVSGKKVFIIDNEGNQITNFGGSLPQANQSAFGTLETAELTPVIQGDFVYGLNTQIWNTAVVSGTGATVDTNASRLRIQSGTGTAGYAYIQTRRPVRYRAGQGQTVRFTPLFTAGVASNIQLWGMGTIVSNAPHDGYFFGYNGTSFGIVHYNAGTPTWTAQASWNGATLPFTWNPVFGTSVMIKYPYLGFGDTFFYVQNPASGAWILAHTIRYANTTATTQVTNPTLKFTGFTLNSGNVANQIMYCGSYSAFISGTRSYIGNPKWAMDASLAGVTTEANLLTLKNSTTYNTVTNTGLMRLTGLSISSSAASGISIFRLKMNATVGGSPSFATINGTTANQGVTITSGNSIASYDIAGTTITGGIMNFSVALDNPSEHFIDLQNYEIIVPPTETITVSAYSSISATVACSLIWSEDT